MNLIDLDVLDYNNEPVGLEIIRLNSEIVHLSKIRTLNYIRP